MAVTDPCPYGPKYQVFWNMRYALLRRFDEARVDATGLYTMVPEALALDMAARAGGKRTLDLCSGIGAMSLALARRGQQVTAVELDPERVAMARHNAHLYAVSDRIDFRIGDITSDETLKRLPANIDTLFMDPPWGSGPGDYLERPLTRLEDLRLADVGLRRLARRIPCREVMMRFPPNFDVAVFRNVRGEKLAYVTPKGYLHFYFVRMSRASFCRIPDRGAWPPDSPQARQGFVAISVQP